ncbi:hypothetical protein UJ101_02340 [Flavobacteriaceae bacterium UJ101]|nr:hypothetical protein UJ101_02340 [Flavobacteriaceae bacterium UJ101]
MKKLLLLLICLPIVSFSQFKFSVEGLNYEIFTYENYKAEEIHSELRDWVNINFMEPKNAIVADAHGKYLKLKGYAPDAACEKKGKECYSMQYAIEFKFRDSKMIAKPIVYQIKSPTFGYRQPEAHWFKKDGTPKPKNVKTIQLAGEFFDRMLSRIDRSIRDTQLSMK